MNWFKQLLMTLALAAPLSALAGGTPATMYKNPGCTCCENYAKYMKAHGFDVKVVPTHDLSLIHREHKVPKQLEGCHTTLIDGYVFEGHIPIDSVNRFLEQRPKAKGLSVPGMPAGSPGMVGTKKGPIEVYYLTDTDTGKPRVYATH